MTDTEESFSDTEATNLCQKALFVQSVSRPIDLNSVPADGHEFIHKSRLEDSLLQFSSLDITEEQPKPSESNGVDKNCMRLAVKEFSFIANDLKSKRNMLEKKFKPSNNIPIFLEEECCTYCLGSEKSSSIYASDPCPSVEAHLPMLGDLIHLNRANLFILLKSHFKWFEKIGMDKTIHIWMFALLLCVTKPITDHEEEFLEELHDDLKTYIDECKEEEELIRVHLIVSILKNYFCINLSTTGLGFLLE